MADMEHAPWDTIPQLIVDSSQKYAEVEGVSDGDVSFNYAELAERIHQSARALMASGIEPGDRVAIWSPNIHEFVVSALSVYCAGAVLVPVNTRFKGNEAAFVLERSKAKLLFTVSGFLDIDYVGMLDGQPGLEALQEIVVIRGETGDSTTPLDQFIARADTVSAEAQTARAQAVTRDDLCHILFTSGTTGQPKGVMLEHGTVCDVYLQMAFEFGMEFGDRALVVLPFFHSFGLHIGILSSIMKGITILPQLVFDTTDVMRRIQDDRVTFFPGPPTVFQAMVDSPDRDKYDLSTLRSVALGGASFTATLVERLQNELKIERVQSGYGLTETSGSVAACSPPSSAEAVANTTGHWLPGLEVRIAAEDGTEVPQGEPGEILVRGYALMRGYLDDPEATAEAIDSDGWLHTGDVGIIRDDGNLVVTDRMKDMYSIGGFNAYPAEIETTLAKHPDIAQAAVIGVPDELMGEVGMAFIIAAEGATPDGAEVITWSKAQMANYKVPRFVEFVAELPLNATGKVLKTSLRDAATEILES